MDWLAQAVVNGLAVGSLYALAALGLVLIFKTTEIVNFAQGEMAMASTYVAFALLVQRKLPYAVAVAGALLFAAVLGALIEHLFMRPLRNASHLSQIMVTLGLFLVINGVVGMIFSYEPTAFPAPWPGDPFKFGGVALGRDHLLALLVGLALMAGLFALFRFTLLGIAMRATAQRLETSWLMGIRVNRIFSLTWGLGSALGAVAGLLIAPAISLDPNFMGEMAIKAFAAAILGGFTSLPGAVVGGLMLGVLENVVAGFISPELKTAFAFSLILAVLVVRPQGLLGAPAHKKV